MQEKPSRRDVLKLAGAAAVAGGARLTPLTMVPQKDHVYRAPENKGWTASDFARFREPGKPFVARGAELAKIGMPVGGLCTGQLYLGGDGRLMNWDIFNQPQRSLGDGNYKNPPDQTSPIDQGFAIRWRGASGEGRHTLDRHTFRDTEFQGQYPIGTVRYRSRGIPLQIDLEAFSPFCPLDADDSGIPVTCMDFSITNTSREDLEVTLAGWLENAALKFTGAGGEGSRWVRKTGHSDWTGLLMGASPDTAQAAAATVFEDWSKGTWEGWTVEGDTFGDRPYLVTELPSYMGSINATTKYLANSHQTRGGQDVIQADNLTGKLTSRPFTVRQKFIVFKLAGGNHKGKTCLNLVVDGQIVRSQEGTNTNRLDWKHFDVTDLVGREACIEIVDQQTGGWGQISVGEILFADDAHSYAFANEVHTDDGTMCLGVIGTGEVHADVEAPLDTVFEVGEQSTTKGLQEKMVSAVQRTVKVAAGETQRLTFFVGWHFPIPWRDSLSFLTGIDTLKRWYATKWEDAGEAVDYTVQNWDRFRETTHLWRDTWHDSTLPQWFLERTFVNTSILASSTCYRFDNDRFYGWEGIYCCAGTCTHVWGYAQSSGRVFPALERALREKVDFGTSWHDNGAIDYRGEAAKSVAHDGQCTVILRAYREHLMSPDIGYLTELYPRIKRSIQHLISEDGAEDGILEGRQYNTLDANWYGPMAWISSLYLAVLEAGKAMADEMEDRDFSTLCRRIADEGRKKIVADLYNGEYFVHHPDPNHPEANNTNDGCHIDQVFGQSWAHQVGLPRVIDEAHSKSALRSLWRYSFCPDVGPYRSEMTDIKGGRWYAMPGEGGLLMCSWPRGGAERATGKGQDDWAAMYFNECMHGFEYQVAAHMMSEGMVDEALGIVRSLHERYLPHKRNPYNEIECGDHYARSMASHGVYVSACGFYHHGPKGIIGFDPKLTPEDFRCAWIGCEGWGTYSQRKVGSRWEVNLDVKWGRLRLNELRLAIPASRWTGSPSIQTASEGRIQFNDLVLEAGKSVTLTSG